MKNTKLDWSRFIVEILVVGLLFWTLSATIESNNISNRALEQSDKDSKYRYLAGMWNDIMEKSVEYPEYSNKNNTLKYRTVFEGDQRRRYENYARWIGGYIEDLFYNEYAKEGWSFYDPWINNMLEIHTTWFKDHIDYYKETPDFYNRLMKLK